MLLNAEDFSDEFRAHNGVNEFEKRILFTSVAFFLTFHDATFHMRWPWPFEYAVCTKNCPLMVFWSIPKAFQKMTNYSLKTDNSLCIFKWAPHMKSGIIKRQKKATEV